MKSANVPNISDVRIEGGLFGRIAAQMKEQVIPFQWDVLNDRTKIRPNHAIENFTVGNSEGKTEYPSHCVANFKIAAGLETGEFYGMVFQDSDLAKWIEAAAYTLETAADQKLEQEIDAVIDVIEKAQQEDGYLNTYFTVREPGKRWTNLCECHELYCAGHMMEAAVAYYEATGKEKLLTIMLKMARHIDSVFGPAAEGKLPGYPGHEEIELALVRMYGVTREKWLLKLAQYFIDERGKNPLYFDIEFEKRNRSSHFSYLYPPFGMYSNGPKYAQYHMPVRGQKVFVGHAVRCMYLACGMADVARETGDQELFSVCRTLFENMAERRMYLTGGIGSSSKGEVFTSDYDLPNDLVYGETCASVGLVFFAHRMLQLDCDSRYADAMERALYNTCIAGMALDGKSFFYVNPLEVIPEIAKNNPDKKHVLATRPEWFGCACCPPNLARLVASIGKYIYSVKENTVYVHLYIQNHAALTVGDEQVTVHLKTEYPHGQRIEIEVSAGNYSLALRIPDWSEREWKLCVDGQERQPVVEKGYAVIPGPFLGTEKIELELDQSAHRVYANPNVASDVGKVALQYGPLVYCMEEADNGAGLARMYLDKTSALWKSWKADKLCGITEIHAEGHIVEDGGQGRLYQYEQGPSYREKELVFIPYYTWANRGENEMTVWVHEYD